MNSPIPFCWVYQSCEDVETDPARGNSFWTWKNSTVLVATGVLDKLYLHS